MHPFCLLVLSLMAHTPTKLAMLISTKGYSLPAPSLSAPVPIDTSLLPSRACPDDSALCRVVHACQYRSMLLVERRLALALTPVDSSLLPFSYLPRRLSTSQFLISFVVDSTT